jgi:hypothetical protein
MDHRGADPSSLRSTQDDRRGTQTSNFGLQTSQFLDDLFLVREASLVVLGENLLIAGDDLEDAAAAADELRLDAELRFDFGRQTGGPRKVVSNAAVMDGDVHRFPQMIFTRMAVMLS